MAYIEVKSPDIMVLEFRQEKGDQDYGSCLWSRFYLDMENYHLSIESDCGNYGHGWIRTPKSESFLKLMSRIDDDYLLGKISTRNVVDGDQTWKNVKEYINEVLDGEEPNFDFEDVENVCYYSEKTEVYDELINSLKYTNANNDFFDSYQLINCIEMQYPYNAQKIANIFTKFVQPKIKELLEVSK